MIHCRAPRAFLKRQLGRKSALWLLMYPLWDEPGDYDPLVPMPKDYDFKERWLAARTRPCGSWENGYNESFNGKLRDECLNGEIFCSLKETQVVIEGWWLNHYNMRRPLSSLG